MENLLKSQIHENCKLALPDGLKDLMSDISREVLRAQPQNLYQFIANYLGALLEARETLTIACQVCSDICKCTCDSIKPELYHELRKIGFNEEDVENAIEVIEKHLKDDHKADESVKEQSLIMKLMRKTGINESQLSEVQHAIQKAFKRHSLGQRDLMDFQNGTNKEPTEAVHHTLQLHAQNKPIKQNETEEMFVAPDFKPCVTTVSSTSLAGSYVSLPKLKPYSAHDYEILSAIPEKERLSIYYTENATSTKIKPKGIEISKETNGLKKNDEKYKAPVFFDDLNDDNNDEFVSIEAIDDYTEASTSTGLKRNRVKISEEIAIEEIEETYKNEELIEDNSDDEVQEFIENVESGNESIVSSIEESYHSNIDEN